MSEGSITTFTATITWTSSDAVINNYVVEWERVPAISCPNEHQDSVSITDVSNRQYQIMNLFGDSQYNITVRATNDAGSAVSQPITITTRTAGKPIIMVVFLLQ